MKSLRISGSVLLLLTAGCEKPAPVASVHGPTNPSAEQQAQSGVRYYGAVVELRPEKEQQYRELHAAVWPDVLAAIKKANIRNYNIFAAELGGKRYLFSFFEYHGSDADRDLATLANDPTTRDKWWPLTDACQQRLPGTPAGQQWKSLEQLMHIE
jgi:L-rhamnose mutarotase